MAVKEFRDIEGTDGKAGEKRGQDAADARQSGHDDIATAERPESVVDSERGHGNGKKGKRIGGKGKKGGDDGKHYGGYCPAAPGTGGEEPADQTDRRGSGKGPTGDIGTVKTGKKSFFQGGHINPLGFPAHGILNLPPRTEAAAMNGKPFVFTHLASPLAAWFAFLSPAACVPRIHSRRREMADVRTDSALPGLRKIEIPQLLFSRTGCGSAGRNWWFWPATKFGWDPGTIRGWCRTIPISSGSGPFGATGDERNEEG